jgi:pimeloyl-ACP methyl ester carboxylesterase
MIAIAFGRLRSQAHMTVRDSEQILEDPPPPAAEARLAYGQEPLQFGDLRLPPGAGPHPVAVVVHGGSWKAMHNLIHTGHMCVALAGAGIATWNVEYRRVGDPGGGWPGSLEDVVAAATHARRLPGIDAGRIVLVGHSAGGHLALLAGARTGLPVVALAAVSDVEAWENDAVQPFLDGASPAETSPRRLLPLGVPQTLVHGTDDDTVPFSLSASYAAAANGEAQLVPLRGAGHFEPIDPLSAEWPTVLHAIEALL